MTGLTAEATGFLSCRLKSTLRASATVALECRVQSKYHEGHVKGRHRLLPPTRGSVPYRVLTESRGCLSAGRDEHRTGCGDLACRRSR